MSPPAPLAAPAVPHHRKKLAWDTLALLGANIAGSLLGFVRGFYIARFLLPADYGLWTLAATALNYGNYADLGLNNGLLIKAGRLNGRGERADAEGVLRRGFTAILLVAGTLGLLLMAAPAVLREGAAGGAALLRLIALGLVVLATLNIYQVVARIRARFAAISLSTVLTSAAALGGAIWVGTAWHQRQVEGLVVVSLLGSALAVAWLAWATPTRPAWPVDRKECAGLLRTGIPVTLVPLAFTLFQSVDRWLVAATVPREALGYYGFGSVLGLFLYTIPNTLAIVLFTRQLERFGATGDPRAAASLVAPPLQLCAYAMAVIGGAAALAVPFLTDHVVPSYARGARAAVWQIVGNSLLFAVPVASNFMISTGRQAANLAYLGLATVVEAALVSTLGRTHWGIDGAAAAVALSDALFAGLLVAHSLRMLYASAALRRRKLAEMAAPFACCLPAGYLLARLYVRTGGLAADFGRWCGMEIAYLLVAGGICLLLAWHSGVIRLLFPKKSRVLPA